jgi:hypothetical protein
METQASKGDLALVEIHSNYHYLQSPSTQSTRFELAEVWSASLTGKVTKLRRQRDGMPQPVKHFANHVGRIFIAKRSTLTRDAADILATLVYPTSFETPADARAFLATFRAEG